MQCIDLLLKFKVPVEQWHPENAITPFERKYAAANQSLFRIVVNITDLM